MKEQLEQLISRIEAKHAQANEQAVRWGEEKLRAEGALMVLGELKQLLTPAHENTAEGLNL